MSKNDYHLATDGSMQPGLGPDQTPTDPFELALWSLRRQMRDQRASFQKLLTENLDLRQQLRNEMDAARVRQSNAFADITEWLIRADAEPKLVASVAALADLAMNQFAHLDTVL